jgi:hypothetical protein
MTVWKNQQQNCIFTLTDYVRHPNNHSSKLILQICRIMVVFKYGYTTLLVTPTPLVIAS